MTEKIDAAESEEMPESNTVDGLTIQKLCNDFKLESIDILKMDIEGAEYEVFEDAENWLPKVGNLIVELHERFKPGCNRRFYIKSAGFDKEWVQGENVFLSREKDN